jgi:hypothetical protein
MSCWFLILFYEYADTKRASEMWCALWQPCRIWCSHNGSYEELYLVGYNSVEYHPTFRRNVSPPSSGSCLDYSSTLNLEATCSSETSVDLQRTTRCYIPEDRTRFGNRVSPSDGRSLRKILWGILELQLKCHKSIFFTLQRSITFRKTVPYLNSDFPLFLLW